MAFARSSAQKSPSVAFLSRSAAAKSSASSAPTAPAKAPPSRCCSASSSVEVRRKIGFLPEDFRFYDWLTASELLTLHGRLCGLTPAQLRDRVPAFLDLVGLMAHRERRLRGFSKGMLQRIGLAQALIHEPELVFLDEPTSGLATSFATSENTAPLFSSIPICSAKSKSLATPSCSSNRAR